MAEEECKAKRKKLEPTATKYNPQDLTKLISNSIEPILFENILPWQMKQWTLNDWKEHLNDAQLEFRCGQNVPSLSPQWERTCRKFTGDFSDFVDFIKTNSENWLYFDYKHLNEWLLTNAEIVNDINWDFMNISDKSAKDSTIWIGSKGAHTPCHKDTYGYNLVAQIYGTKLWLLFPPEEDLNATRVPYEESSVYSKINFFSPISADFSNGKRCRKIILNPGDVLFVPNNWWHYVENLETAISINMWLPHENDNNERLKESIVQFFIKQLAQNLDNVEKQRVLNPNSEEILDNSSIQHSLSLIQCCINNCKEEKKQNLSSPDGEKMLDKYKFIKTIPILDDVEFKQFLRQQLNRFNNAKSLEDQIEQNTLQIDQILNAITSDDVLTLIKNKLLN